MSTYHIFKNSMLACIRSSNDFFMPIQFFAFNMTSLAYATKKNKKIYLTFNVGIWTQFIRLFIKLKCLQSLFLFTFTLENTTFLAFYLPFSTLCYMTHYFSFLYETANKSFATAFINGWQAVALLASKTLVYGLAAFRSDNDTKKNCFCYYFFYQKAHNFLIFKCDNVVC